MERYKVCDVIDTILECHPDPVLFAVMPSDLLNTILWQPLPPLATGLQDRLSLCQDTAPVIVVLPPEETSGAQGSSSSQRSSHTMLVFTMASVVAVLVLVMSVS